MNSSNQAPIRTSVPEDSPMVIQRKIAVPGVMPTKKSKQFKAFGHPV